MKPLYDYLEAYILNNIPDVREVLPYQSQIEDIRARTRNPKKYPCVFIEIDTGEIRTLPLNIRKIETFIRFRFAIEGYKFKKISDLEFASDFEAKIAGLRALDTDAIQFSTIHLSDYEIDDNPDQMNEPYIEYTTWYIENSAYSRKNSVTLVPGSLQIDIEIP